MKRIANYLIALALTAFTLTSCEDVPSPFGDIVKPADDSAVVIEPSGTGTEADPFNVAGVIEYVSGLGADVVSPKDVYFKGYVTSITEAYGTQYGNATFEMSDTEDGGNKFLCYRVLYYDKSKYSDTSAPNIKEGSLVVMCGKVVNYKGNTPETSANAAWLYSLDGTKGSGTTPVTETLGTKDAPLTVAKALEYINKLEDNGTTKEDAYVAGKITQIKTAADKIPTYKNIDYVISDGTNELTVFRGKNIDNTDFTEAGQINVGDEVVVLGKLTKSVNNGTVTPEVAQGNYIVKLTKGGSTPSGGDAKGTGTANDPFNIAAAIAKCKEVGETASTEKYYVKGIVVSGGTVSGGYGNVTFKMGDSKDATELFTAYQVAGSDGEKLADGFEVKEGSTVIVYGPIVNFKGNTPETSGKSAAQIVTIDGKKTNEGGSGATGGDGTQNNPFNVAEAIAKCKEVGQTASTEKYYIKGIVVSGGTVSGGYGNVTFKMGDSKDATELFTAYQVAGSDGEKLADGFEVKEGSTVIVYGPIMNYNGKTPETAGKSAAQIVTIDGKKTNEGSGSGSGGGQGGGETPSTLTNGGFETWANGLPTGWKSASTASSATLEQSTDAHGGSYACIVKGGGTQNKRLASQEITLEAGTYTFAFYAKATSANKAQVRPGFVPVTDGAVGNYTYGDYADIKTSWSQVSTTFTLDAKTTVCLIVMNPKSGSYSSGEDVIVDDATLTKN